MFADFVPDWAEGAEGADDVSLLSDQERSEARRFKQPMDRVRFIRGRAFVRRSLSRFVDIHPSEWRLERGAAGKPFITGPFASPRMYFNLSHTRGLVLCVVSQFEVMGVDAEAHSVLPDIERVAGLVLSPREIAEWEQAPPPKKLPRFLDLWTLKEAYAKARGLGLGMPFCQVGFRQNSSGTISAEFGAEVDDDPALWRFWQPRISARHSVAVAVKVDVESSTDPQLEFARPTA